VKDSSSRIDQLNVSQARRRKNREEVDGGEGGGAELQPMSPRK